MSPQRRKGIIRLIVGVVVVGLAVAAIILWPAKSNSVDKNTDKPRVKATPTAPSATQQYFNGVSQAVKAGNLQQQASYVAEYVRQEFLRTGVLMFPRGTTVTFKADTLVAETPTTGHVKATATTTQDQGKIVTNYVVLLIKEKDSAGHMVWHISDTEEVKN